MSEEQARELLQSLKMNLELWGRWVNPYLEQEKERSEEIREYLDELRKQYVGALERACADFERKET